MLKYENNSDTAIVVVHEIYGVNQHMKSICEKLSTYKYDVICPNLFDEDITYDYKQEDDAYHHFKNQLGFKKASHKLKILIKQIRGSYKYVYMVGYSVGATCAWLCSEEKGLCDAVVGYYGSRIRDYIEVNPRCSTLLFFPCQENSFNVDDLIYVLQHKENVQIQKFTGDHGFSDPFNTRYCHESADKSFNYMIRFFQEAKRNKSYSAPF